MIGFQPQNKTIDKKTEYCNQVAQSANIRSQTADMPEEDYLIKILTQTEYWT